MKIYLFALALLLAALGCTTNNQTRFQALRNNAFESRRTEADRPSTPNEQAISKQKNTVDILEGQKTLTLDTLLQAVIDRNPSLHAMQERFRQAVTEYPQAVSFDDPKASYSVVPSSVDSSTVDFAQKIELSQHLPWRGKLDLKGEIALSNAESTREERNALEQKLILLTSNAYFDYYILERALQINEVNQALLQKFKTVAETKYSAGTASKQDALQAEVEYIHLKHQEIVLSRQKKNTIGKLNTLLNRPPGAPLPSPPSRLQVRTMILDLADLQDSAKQHRPELQGLAFKLQAKRAEQQLAHKDYYPDFTAFGAYNSLWQEEDLQPIIGIGINIPLRLDRRNARLQQTQSAIKELEADFAALEANINFEVKDALDALEESEHVVRLYKTAFLSAARESLAAAESGYHSGANNFLTLLEAEKKVMLIELEYHNALRGYHQSLAELSRAVGIELGRESANHKFQGGSHE